MWLCANRTGSGETRIKPSNGPSISSTRNRAPPIDCAQANKAAITVPLRGAISPTPRLIVSYDRSSRWCSGYALPNRNPNTAPPKLNTIAMMPMSK
jgi:hypothetical protein